MKTRTSVRAGDGTIGGVEAGTRAAAEGLAVNKAASALQESIQKASADEYY